MADERVVPRPVAIMAYRTAAQLLRLCKDPEQIPHADKEMREQVSGVLEFWASGLDEKALKLEVGGILNGIKF